MIPQPIFKQAYDLSIIIHPAEQNNKGWLNNNIKVWNKNIKVWNKNIKVWNKNIKKTIIQCNTVINENDKHDISPTYKYLAKWYVGAVLLPRYW